MIRFDHWVQSSIFHVATWSLLCPVMTYIFCHIQCSHKPLSAVVGLGSLSAVYDCPRQLISFWSITVYPAAFVRSLQLFRLEDTRCQPLPDTLF